MFSASPKNKAYVCLCLCISLAGSQKQNDELTTIIIQIPIMGKTRAAKAADEQCEKTQEDAVNDVNKKKRHPKRRKAICRTQKEEVKSKDEDQKVQQVIQQEPTIEQIPIQFFCHSDNDYICPICLNYIVRAVCGPCGHSFCEVCANEYLLFFDECSQCSRKLRSVKLSYNKILDSLIEAFVETFHPDEAQEFRARVDRWKDWDLRKRPSVLEAGVRVDIRDQNYIWCTAIIYRTVCKWQENRTKFIFIMYDGQDKRYNQQICQHSPRIAALGFYSNRQDIPHYQRTEDGRVANRDFAEFSNGQEVMLLPIKAQDN